MRASGDDAVGAIVVTGAGGTERRGVSIGVDPDCLVTMGTQANA